MLAGFDNVIDNGDDKSCDNHIYHDCGDANIIRSLQPKHTWDVLPPMWSHQLHHLGTLPGETFRSVDQRSLPPSSDPHQQKVKKNKKCKLAETTQK